jgi:hypothetical protein
MKDKKQQIKDKIKDLQDKLADIEAKEEAEKNKVDFIVIDGWAYETKEHDFNKKLSEIKIPNGKELWSPSDCFRMYENKELREKLNLKDCWFFVKQIKEDTTDVARFYAYSYGVYFRTYYDSDYSYSSLGVRFKWKVKR